MGPKESNAGFVDLHNPGGLVLIVIAFLFLIGITIMGAAFFKAAQEKDKETRERLKKAQNDSGNL
ncbi:hypothetical protein [Fimbriimonas ginsengisoli]|uniref:Uncharacterized protein n=1 Tax=Fimbriimonas ginsengisoli Gsoil 348 TaxID=661478 RepID=A0A068NKN1_FIMGI|nr:hypothetical protein [Fimbriimonas ginsengisoli]AIE84118.1 hypothetical protein OP10G_0750 [Fimbriimonas ginsengisoli Gsoil 348]